MESRVAIRYSTKKCHSFSLLDFNGIYFTRRKYLSGYNHSSFMSPIFGSTYMHEQLFPRAKHMENKTSPKSLTNTLITNVIIATWYISFTKAGPNIHLVLCFCYPPFLKKVLIIFF